MVTAIELPFSSVTRRFPPRRVIAAGLGAARHRLRGDGARHLGAALAATVVVWTLGEIVAAPISTAYVADISPPHMRGRYAGAWGMTYGLALIIGPALGTAVYAADAKRCSGAGASRSATSPPCSCCSPAARPRGYAITASRSTSAA